MADCPFSFEMAFFATMMSGPDEIQPPPPGAHAMLHLARYYPQIQIISGTKQHTCCSELQLIQPPSAVRDPGALQCCRPAFLRLGFNFPDECDQLGLNVAFTQVNGVFSMTRERSSEIFATRTTSGIIPTIGAGRGGWTSPAPRVAPIVHRDPESMPELRIFLPQRWTSN